MKAVLFQAQMPYPVQNPQGYYGGPGTFTITSAQNVYGGYPGMYGSAQGMPRKEITAPGREMPAPAMAPAGNKRAVMALRLTNGHNGGSYPGGGAWERPAPRYNLAESTAPFHRSGMNSHAAVRCREASDQKVPSLKRIRKNGRKIRQRKNKYQNRCTASTCSGFRYELERNRRKLFMKTILLLEDDENLNRGISLRLEKEGLPCSASLHISQARRLFS